MVLLGENSACWLSGQHDEECPGGKKPRTSDLCLALVLRGWWEYVQEMRMRTSYLSQPVLIRGRKTMPQRQRVWGPFACPRSLGMLLLSSSKSSQHRKEEGQAQLSTRGNRKRGQKRAQSKYVMKEVIFNPILNGQ